MELIAVNIKGERLVVQAEALHDKVMLGIQEEGLYIEDFWHTINASKGEGMPEMYDLNITLDSVWLNGTGKTYNYKVTLYPLQVRGDYLTADLTNGYNLIYKHLE